MRMIKSALSVAMYTVLSRITGFLRDILMAKFIGAGVVMDALVIAIKVPSFLRRIFAEGAFNSSFVPIFSALNVTHKKEARAFVQDVLSLMTMILISVVVVFEIFMPAILGTFLLKASPEMLSLSIGFSRITFPFILLISLTALFSGVLNSLDKFTAAASSQVVGNLFIVICLLMYDPTKIAEGGHVAFTIMGSGVVQLLWVLVPCWIYGIKPAFHMPHMSEDVRSFGRKMLPAAIGSGVLQINLLIDMFIASLLPTGTYSYLYYADRLYHLPISVTGTAMGTVLLPLLSRLWREHKIQDGIYYQNRAIEFSMLITFPAMLGLIFLAHPMVLVIFERGAFDAHATKAVAETVMGFSTGLPAYILIKILSSSFFAHQDTVTPIKVALIGMLANVILNFALIGEYQHMGIAMATSLAAWLNAGILFVLLRKRELIQLDHALFVYIGKTLLSCMLALVAIYIAYDFGIDLIQNADGVMEKIYGLSSLIIPAALVFFASAHFLKCLKFKDYKAV